MKNVLILGANSAIAGAAARLWSARGWKLYLVGRDPQKLDALVQDLKARGNERIFAAPHDLSDASKHERLIESAAQALGGIDIAFIAHGELGDQKASERHWDDARRVIDINFLSPASLLTILANLFEGAGRGHLVAITSVAGERGKASNYVYGSAKGGLSVFMSGLRNRLAKKCIPVTEIRLGFVDTPMTAAFKKGVLWASPAAVARGIVRAVDRQCDVVYLLWFWRWLMLIIRNIPERIFKKLSL